MRFCTRRPRPALYAYGLPYCHVFRRAGSDSSRPLAGRRPRLVLLLVLLVLLVLLHGRCGVTHEANPPHRPMDSDHQRPPAPASASARRQRHRQHHHHYHHHPRREQRQTPEATPASGPTGAAAVNHLPGRSRSLAYCLLRRGAQRLLAASVRPQLNSCTPMSSQPNASVLKNSVNSAARLCFSRTPASSSFQPEHFLHPPALLALPFPFPHPANPPACPVALRSQTFSPSYLL